MDKHRVAVHFEGLTAAEAGVAAQSLQQLLAESSPEVEATLERDRSEALDMGATLVLLLGAPAIIAVAKGIAAFIGKRGDRAGTLVVEWVGADGGAESIRFEGGSADAARIAEALRGSGSKTP